MKRKWIWTYPEPLQTLPQTRSQIAIATRRVNNEQSQDDSSSDNSDDDSSRDDSETDSSDNETTLTK